MDSKRWNRMIVDLDRQRERRERKIVSAGVPLHSLFFDECACGSTDSNVVDSNPKKLPKTVFDKFESPRPSPQQNHSFTPKSGTTTPKSG